MSDVKISQLPAATTPLSGTELFPIVQGGVTKQVAVGGTIPASQIINTPAGTVAATTVQAAIDEIVSDNAASSGSSLVGFLQSGTGAVATTVQTKLRESVSVKDFGAVGDGVTDDTAAIQAAINAVLNGINAPACLFVPAGEYVVSSPLTLPINFVGLSITGAGKRGVFQSDSNRRGTHIKFTGSGVLFSVASGMAVLVEDIGFSSTGANTCFGFTQPGNGSGMSTFVRVRFENFAIGVQFGVLSTDGGCADVGFDYCEFLSCTIGVKVVNNDGANYSFNRLYANQCATVISSVPGSFNLKNVQLVGCGSDTTSVFDWTNIGDNSGFVIIDGCRFEQNTKKLVSMVGKGRLYCFGLEEAQTASGSSHFYLKGVNAKVVLSRFISGTTATPLAKLEANSGSQRSNITFDQVYFAITADKDVYQKIIGFVSTGFANSYKTVSCTVGSFSNPLPDMGGRTYEGKVVVCGQSINATLLELTVNGGAADVQTRIDSQYDYRAGTITIIGKTSGGYCRFVRQVVWSNAGVQSVQTIGTDLDTITGCSVTINSSDNNGLRIYVTGPAAATCDWRAFMLCVPTGFL